MAWTRDDRSRPRLGPCRCRKKGHGAQSWSPALSARDRRLITLVVQTVGLALVGGVAACLGIAGWRVCGKYGERCEEAGQLFPGYNAETRRIDFVMHDLNGNGVIDTWVYRNGPRIEEIGIDRNEDGTIDRVLLPDEKGTLRLAQVRPSR